MMTALLQKRFQRSRRCLFANFRLENGALGHAAVARSAHGRRIGVPGGTNIWGSGGSLSDGNYYTDEGQSGSAVGRFKRNDLPRFEAAFPNGISDAYALEQLDWLQAIDEGRPAKMTGEEGTIDLALAYAILESGLLKRESHAGRSVEWRRGRISTPYQRSLRPVNTKPRRVGGFADD